MDSAIGCVMERVRERAEHNKQSYISFYFVHWIPHTPTKVSLTHCIYCDRWWCRGLLLLLFATFAAWVNVAVPILVVSKIKDKDFEQKWQQHSKIASSILLVQKIRFRSPKRFRSRKKISTQKHNLLHSKPKNTQRQRRKKNYGKSILIMQTEREKASGRKKWLFLCCK